MARLKVLISGAGVTGNALAFWLSKQGHNVTVIERFPSPRDTGLQIDLRGHGIEVMRRMGFEQAFRAKAAPEQGIEVISSTGRRWAYFPANKSQKGPQAFTSEFEIMRGDMCHIMYDATKERAKYVFGTSIESFEYASDGSVEVRFSDGKTDVFDLVVGADGVGSRTRKLMLGSDADAFHPLGGIHVGYFTIPRPIKEGEDYNSSVYIAPKKRAVMIRRHSPHEIQAYLMCKTSSVQLMSARSEDVKKQKEALAQIFQGAGGQTEEIVRSMMGADDFYCERLGQVKLDSWSQGCVTLVGDAAYCPSAATGMGTTSGIVGAYILAGEVERFCGSGSDGKDDLPMALKVYEEKFRPFMDQVQKGLSGDAGWWLMPVSSFGVAVMNIFLAIAAFLRLDIMGEWILREDVKGWKLPEYEEMLGVN